MSSKPFTTCLWFDTQAEEAANFYVSILMKKFDIAALRKAYTGQA